MAGQSSITATKDGRFAAIAGAFGAVLASSCCVVPLILVTLGASGAWIGNLSVFDPYKGYFAAIALVFVGTGFWQVYKKKDLACQGEIRCASTRSRRVTIATLWIATALVVTALTIDSWAPFFY